MLEAEKGNSTHSNGSMVQPTVRREQRFHFGQPHSSRDKIAATQKPWWKGRPSWHTCHPSVARASVPKPSLYARRQAIFRNTRVGWGRSGLAHLVEEGEGCLPRGRPAVGRGALHGVECHGRCVARGYCVARLFRGEG